jgi:hypothetical protein
MNKFLWKIYYKLQYLWDWGMGEATGAVTQPPHEEELHKDEVTKPHSKWR